MKNLAQYLNENLICEGFFDYDTELEKVPAKMQDVAKIKILVKKFSKLGEEGEYDNDDKNNLSPYHKLVNSLSGRLSDRQIASIKDVKNSIKWSDHKTIMKYCDKIFSCVKSAVDKEEKKYGFADYGFLYAALIGIADYLENTLPPDETDKYLGKLANKFNKVFGVNADGLTKISQKYAQTKMSIQKALDTENATIKSINDIKAQFKDHKYTIFASNNDSAAKMFIIDNSEFDNVDDAFENTVKKDKLNYDEYAPFDPKHYDLNNVLREIVTSKKVRNLILVGIYIFGKDKENVIPIFGYIDELPSQEISKLGKDNKIYPRGNVRKSDIKGVAYEYSDTLWTVWK